MDAMSPSAYSPGHRMRPPWHLFAVAALAGGCGSPPLPAPPDMLHLAPNEIPLTVEKSCPGGPDCADIGDGKLYAGEARREITPTVEPFVDLNGDGVHEDGEPYTDLNHNGRFDPVWMAGYHTGLQAFGVHDPNWTRCYALRQNQTTLVHCVLDVVGLMHDELEAIRADLDPALGIDYFMTSATHVHETKDSIGIWGPDYATSGYDPDWMAILHARTVEAATEAVHNLRPAKLSIGSILVEDPGHHMEPYISDSRDPVVIDNRLHLLQLDGEDGKPIVTIINWASHPEGAGDGNRYTSSDYVHYLRESVERGTGSDVVFISAALGGQIGPNRIQPVTDDGRVVTERGLPFADAWGNSVARFALRAFAARTPVDSPRLAFRTTRFNVHIDNTSFHLAARLHLFHRQFFGYNPKLPSVGANAPVIDTEMAYITLGPAAIITCPGELLPELFIGGYDGSRAGAWPFLDPMDIAPPDVAEAPPPPYLFDFMGGDPDSRMVFGLTLDFVGYIIPRYNFVLDEDAPYIAQAPGDHYEETNSLGPRAEPEIVGTMRQLVAGGR